MKSLLKWILRILGILVLLLIALLLWINFTPLKTYTNEAPELTVVADSASIAEGRRIASMLCNQCHRSKDGTLGGGLMEDGQFGKIYSKNITQHPEYGIADYTDGEIAYILRTGIAKDGRYTPPWMIKVPQMSDDDVHDIIAFLRSDDPLVRPSDSNPPDSEFSFMSKALLKLGMFAPLPYPKETVVAPDPSEQVRYGKYLVDAKFDCYACHSADFKTQNLMVPELSGGYLGGGNPIPDLEGNIILSANLTFDKETGIGNWTEEEFVRSLRSGVRPDNTAFRLPMNPYPAITDDEASAIYTYLQSVPVIHNPKLLK